MESKSQAAAAGGSQDQQLSFSLFKKYFQNAFDKQFNSVKGDKSVFFDEGILKQLSFVIQP